MDDIKTVITCPLGSTCKTIKQNPTTGENEIHLCRWVFKVSGTHPTTGEKIDSEDCAMAVLPLMLHETARQQVNTTAAVDDLKNVMNTTGEAMTNQMIVANQINSQNLLQKY